MTPISLAHNAVTARLYHADREAMLEAQRVLSYRVDGFEHMAAFQSGGWNGKSSFFDWGSCTFPAGFAYLVHKALTRAGYKVQLVRKPLPEPLGPVNPKVDDFPEDPRYDFQYQVVDCLLRYGQIIARVATGGGKSRIAKLCIARLGRPTLFLTTRGVLMYQMRDSLASLGRTVGVMGDGEWSPRRGVNVGMVQTIMSRLAEPDPRDPPEKQEAQRRRRAQMIKILEFFEFVILEEAHEVSGNSFFEMMRLCRNAYYRLALTATPFMKESEEANMRLMASSGQIAIQVSEQLLIERGILARPYFKHIALAGQPEGIDRNGKLRKLYRSTPWQSAYRIGIVGNTTRNKAIVYEAARATKHGLSVMILVMQQEHGKILKDMLQGYGIRAAYIYGEDDQPARKRSLDALKDGRISVLIGSTILDVGVDVPAVGMVVLAGGGKAEVALRQRIGRGLREKKNGLPNIALIVDFEDLGNNHLRDHARQRKNIVESTPGFREGILKPGEDFDYAALGLTRASTVDLAQPSNDTKSECYAAALYNS